jgi:hypothetical protein
LANAGDYINSSDHTKGYITPPTFAPFQLIAPNLECNPASEDQEIRSAVDLLMLSSIGHLHLENIQGTANPNFANPDWYATISELLGDEKLHTHLQGRGIPAVTLGIIRPDNQAVNYYPPDFRIDATNVANRFIARLDYTLFIPYFNSKALPYEAIPLACRILDAFETMSVDPTVPLVQGRININTAPPRVIEALP